MKGGRKLPSSNDNTTEGVVMITTTRAHLRVTFEFECSKVLPLRISPFEVPGWIFLTFEDVQLRKSPRKT